MVSFKMKPKQNINIGRNSSCPPSRFVLSAQFAVMRIVYIKSSDRKIIFIYVINHKKTRVNICIAPAEKIVFKE